MTIEIPLSRGLFALIDDFDAQKVAGLKFCATRGANTWYAVNGEVGTLHRFLLDAPREVLIDHRDTNGLNNQRRNLRYATRRQNARNRTGAARNANRTSRYLGVSWSKQMCRWRTVIAAGAIKADGCLSSIEIGCFDSEVIAARAYDAAALLCFGEFASPNFRDSIIDLDLLKKRIFGEVERVSSGRFRLRLNRDNHRRELVGMYDTREEAETARLAIPENSDSARLKDYAQYLGSRP